MPPVPVSGYLSTKAVSAAGVALEKFPFDIVPKLPHVELPDVKIPNVNLPVVKIPNIKLPDVKIPNIKLPHVKLSDIHIPPMKIPEIRIPHVRVPNITLPKIPDEALNKIKMAIPEAIHAIKSFDYSKLIPYVGTIGMALVSGAGVVGLIWMFGFGPIGVVAYSLAAVLHGAIGIVAKGSAFAIMQSLGTQPGLVIVTVACIFLLIKLIVSDLSQTGIELLQ